MSRGAVCVAHQSSCVRETQRGWSCRYEQVGCEQTPRMIAQRSPGPSGQSWPRLDGSCGQRPSAAIGEITGPVREQPRCHDSRSSSHLDRRKKQEEEEWYVPPPAAGDPVCAVQRVGADWHQGAATNGLRTGSCLAGARHARNVGEACISVGVVGDGSRRGPEAGVNNTRPRRRDCSCLPNQLSTRAFRSLLLLRALTPIPHHPPTTSNSTRSKHASNKACNRPRPSRSSCSAVQRSAR